MVHYMHHLYRVKGGAHLLSEEDLELGTPGQHRVLGRLAEEGLQSAPPRLYEVLAEALHQPLHHKLLRQRLGTLRSKSKAHLFCTAQYQTQRLLKVL